MRGIQLDHDHDHVELCGVMRLTSALHGEASFWAVFLAHAMGLEPSKQIYYLCMSTCSYFLSQWSKLEIVTSWRKFHICTMWKSSPLFLLLRVSYIPWFQVTCAWYTNLPRQDHTDKFDSLTNENSQTGKNSCWSLQLLVQNALWSTQPVPPTVVLHQALPNCAAHLLLQRIFIAFRNLYPM